MLNFTSLLDILPNLLLLKNCGKPNFSQLSLYEVLLVEHPSPSVISHKILFPKGDFLDVCQKLSNGWQFLFFHDFSTRNYCIWIIICTLVMLNFMNRFFTCCNGYSKFPRLPLLISTSSYNVLLCLAICQVLLVL